jgi:hypothetical protein
MSEPLVTLEIESYPHWHQHFLIARHPEGHGLYGPSGPTTTLGQFRSRAQAEAALIAVRWYGNNRMCDGMRAERERLAQEAAQ